MSSTATAGPRNQGHDFGLWYCNFGIGIPLEDAIGNPPYNRIAADKQAYVSMRFLRKVRV